MIGRMMNIYIRKPVMFTVTWKVNGTVVKTEQVEFGDDATPPTNVNIPEGYEIVKWDKKYTDIRSNLEINAVMKKKSYLVRFFGRLNNVLSEQRILHGESATAPQIVPGYENGYEFKRWNKSFANVKSPIDVYSVWEPIGAITFWRYQLPVNGGFPQAINDFNQTIYTGNFIPEANYRVQIPKGVSAPIDAAMLCYRTGGSGSSSTEYVTQVNNGINYKYFMVKSGDNYITADDMQSDCFSVISPNRYWTTRIVSGPDGIGIIEITPPEMEEVRFNNAPISCKIQISYKGLISELDVFVNMQTILPIWNPSSSNKYFVGTRVTAPLTDMVLLFTLLYFEYTGGTADTGNKPGFIPKLRKLSYRSMTGFNTVGSNRMLHYTIKASETTFNGTVYTNIDNGRGGKLNMEYSSDSNGTGYINLPASGKWHTNGQTELTLQIPAYSQQESYWGIRCTLNK